MIPKRYSSGTVTTDGSGDLSFVLPLAGEVSGRAGFIHSIVYTKPGSNAYSDGVVITATTEKTGITVWSETLTTNASKTVTPSMPIHDSTGTEGTSSDFIPLASEGVIFTIASGGAAKDGSFILVVNEPG